MYRKVVCSQTLRTNVRCMVNGEYMKREPFVPSMNDSEMIYWGKLENANAMRGDPGKYAVIVIIDKIGTHSVHSQYRLKCSNFSESFLKKLSYSECGVQTRIRPTIQYSMNVIVENDTEIVKKW